MGQTYTTQEQLFERISHLKDGIYYIKTTTNKELKQCKLLAEKLEDLPKAISLASTEPFRYQITKKLQMLWTEASSVITKIYPKVDLSKLIPIKRVIDTMFDVVAKGVSGKV